MFDPAEYTIEQCPFCDEEVVIYSHGITACPRCGKPITPCSLCDSCTTPCPYNCTGAFTDRYLKTTNPPITRAKTEIYRAFIENQTCDTNSGATRPNIFAMSRAQYVQKFKETHPSGYRPKMTGRILFKRFLGSRPAAAVLKTYIVNNGLPSITDDNGRLWFCKDGYHWVTVRYEINKGMTIAYELM